MTRQCDFQTSKRCVAVGKDLAPQPPPLMEMIAMPLLPPEHPGELRVPLHCYWHLVMAQQPLVNLRLVTFTLEQQLLPIMMTMPMHR